VAGGWWLRVTADSTCGYGYHRSALCGQRLWLYCREEFSFSFNTVLVCLVEVRCQWCIEVASLVGPPVVAEVGDCSACQRELLPL
jgi:hypothetical protein